MSAAWEAVREAVDAGDAAAVATLVAGFDDGERREVARELPGHLPLARRLGEEKDRLREAERERVRQERLAEQRREAARRGWSEDSVWDNWHYDTWEEQVEERWIEPMRVAGAGTITGAAAVVSWLNRRDLRRWWEPVEVDDVPLILQAVAARPAKWQGDLAVRLALRLRGLRPTVDRPTRLALELLRRTGVEPPAHDPLTVAWIAAVSSPGSLGEDPLLEVMLPRLFEAEGVGRALRDDREWPSALSALARKGRIGREALLDGCLSRFLRGGPAPDMRFFVRLHEALDPTAEEVDTRRRDYLRLLPAAPANVADLALKQVRRLDSVDAEEAGEAVEGLLFRAESRLVLAGLAWLDRLARDQREDLDGYAPALAVALVSESADARARAVRLVVKHAGRFTPPGAEVIVDVVPLLPAVPGSRLAAAFGGEPVAAEPEPQPEPFVPLPLPPAPTPNLMPPPVLTVHELLRSRMSKSQWRSVEDWLDGFVRLVAQERDALTAALAPIAAQFRDEHYWSAPWDLREWVVAMARELADPGAESRAVAPDPYGPRRTVQERVPEPGRREHSRRLPLLRFAEVYQALMDGRLPPYLLATPTHENGRLDAEKLVERLEGYERAGVEALPVDLEQALLRLPRAVPAEVAERAAGLTGEAGRTAARWMTTARPEPRITLRREVDDQEVRLVPEAVGGPTGVTLLDDILAAPRTEEGCDALLGVLPAHREVVAANTVQMLLVHMTSYRKPSPEDLATLACAEGPGGEGVALILAYHLRRGATSGVVTPFLKLAASGGLPGRETGRQLAALLRHHGDSPAEALAVLRTAARRGAHREVWQVMAGLLPAYLPESGERATTAHTRLVEFAADVAEWAQARGELPEIARLAERRRASDLVRHARRLHGLLTGRPG
ncbi:DUF6493 family protein [Streptosporangium carneum]|uniref:DUF7824 domain-containing protein n=1 Tax=Streptosporangium carneum TaxID=47481 RepID=A0A9W6MB12_9ACTN|nr:DUF6493 family protein [Streptosporangium carneum]GLK07869.1 hypothetical protein GCM10017600_12740 [Streptosporangium carneum]